MTISLFLIFIALILAILAILPPMRNYFLLNAAVLFLCVALILESGFVHA